MEGVPSGLLRRFLQYTALHHLVRPHAHGVSTAQFYGTVLWRSNPPYCGGAHKYEIRGILIYLITSDPIVAIRFRWPINCRWHISVSIQCHFPPAWFPRCDAECIVGMRPTQQHSLLNAYTAASRGCGITSTRQCSRIRWLTALESRINISFLSINQVWILYWFSLNCATGRILNLVSLSTHPAIYSKIMN